MNLQEKLPWRRSRTSERQCVDFELQREAETEEIIVANGMLRDAQNPDIAHPVLTHRVQLEYDAMENVISISDQSLTI